MGNLSETTDTQLLTGLYYNTDRKKRKEKDSAVQYPNSYPPDTEQSFQASIPPTIPPAVQISNAVIPSVTPDCSTRSPITDTVSSRRK